MWTNLQNLIRNTDANFALISAITLSAIMLCVGAAVDLTNNVNTRSKLANSVDMAVLTAAISEEQNESDLTLFARDSFDANYDYKQGQSLKSFVVTKPSPDRVRVEAVLSYKLFFGKLLGQESRDMTVTAESILPSLNSLDVALVLDRTGSMWGSNMTNLKSATQDFLEDIERANADIRVSVIPFADYVNIGLDYSNEDWLDLPAMNSGGSDAECSMVDASASTCFNPYSPPQNCQVGSSSSTTDDGTTVTTTTYETLDNGDGTCTDRTTVHEQRANGSSSRTSTRTYTGTSGRASNNWAHVSQTTTGNYCTYSASPAEASDPVIEECSIQNTIGNWYGCVGSRAGTDNLNVAYDGNKIPPALELTCGQSISPLSYDLYEASDKISSLTASGMTYIPAGLMWGWRSLDASEPIKVSTDGPRQKLIILMTDGQNTISQTGLFHTGSDYKAANKLTEQLCTKIKESNVKIATVSYSRGSRDNATVKLLEACASESKLYFEARDERSLKSAFEDAIKSTENIRLVN